MSTEQITTEQAEALLLESFNKVTPAASTQVVPDAVVPEPVEETPPAPAEPAAETGSEATPPAPATPPAADDPYEWVNQVSDPALREKVVAEINERFRQEHQARSDAGRVKALQRKLLEQQHKAAEAKPATQPAPAGSQLTTPESWQSLAKGDPELAEAIEARVKSEIDAAVSSVRNELQEMRKTAVDPLHAQNAVNYREAQFEELKAMVPNVEDVIGSKEYAAWLHNDATDNVRNIAANSPHARDALFVLQAYATDMQRMNLAKPPVVTAPTPANAAPNKADEIAAAREKQLQVQVPRTTTSVAPSGIPQTNGPMTKEQQEAYFQHLMATKFKKT